MDYAKALFITETAQPKSRCLNAVANGIYQNPPLDETTKTCVEANRSLACSNCLSRMEKTLSFTTPALPNGLPPLPPYVLPPPTGTSQTKSRKSWLTPTERKKIESSLLDFETSVWQDERETHLHRARPSFFPHSLTVRLLDNFPAVSTSRDKVFTVLRKHLWPFVDSHGLALFGVLQKLRQVIDSERDKARLLLNAKQRERRRLKKVASSRPAIHESESESSSDSDHSLSY
jgi:hypothetical protein